MNMMGPVCTVGEACAKPIQGITRAGWRDDVAGPYTAAAGLCVCGALWQPSASAATSVAATGVTEWCRA